MKDRFLKAHLPNIFALQYLKKHQNPLHVDTHTTDMIFFMRSIVIVRIEKHKISIDIIKKSLLM